MAINKVHLGYGVTITEVGPGKWQAMCQTDGTKSEVHATADQAFEEIQRWIDVELIRRK